MKKLFVFLTFIFAFCTLPICFAEANVLGGNLSYSPIPTVNPCPNPSSRSAAFCVCWAKIMVTECTKLYNHNCDPHDIVVLVQTMGVNLACDAYQKFGQGVVDYQSCIADMTAYMANDSICPK